MVGKFNLFYNKKYGNVYNAQNVHLLLNLSHQNTLLTPNVYYTKKWFGVTTSTCFYFDALLL